MSKKKKKKTSVNRAQQNPQSPVKLSQCMIVKNEEKNIEKALGWAKDIAYEQIVVDTGSTDRTVELAEKMGARVCHFEWINDFSAAKNFAMNQAKGNWIAILDADEYILREDAKEMMAVLKKIQNNSQHINAFDSLSCSWVQLNDEGKAYTVLTVQRIFQNRPDLRYEGTIHEAVRIKNKAYNAENLRIMHTGYSQTAFNAADKRERNIKLLRAELERDPNNPHTMLYLADSIKAAGTEEARAEAEELYLQALANKKPAEPAIKRLAYDFLLARFIYDPVKNEAAKKLFDEAITVLPNNLDYYYYRAVLNNQNRNYKKAIDDLLKCEQFFMESTTLPETRVLMPCPILLYRQFILSTMGLGDELKTQQYTTIFNTMLSEGKEQPEVLGTFLADMFKQGKTGIEVFEAISGAYDINDPRDLMHIARAAKNCGAITFAQKLMEMTKEKLG